MWERLLLSLLLLSLGAALYFLLQQRQQRRISTMQVAGGRPLLLYFRSDHCPPCHTQARFLEALPDTITTQIAIEQVDVEQEKDKANQYGVFTLPTTLLLDPSGAVRHINYGLTETGKLARQLESVL
jgi:thioredoxin 1